MSIEIQFTKESVDNYLNILAKEYKRRNRKADRVELILVGGASVLVNYGFRDMTTDIDAIILADSVMKDAIYAVAEKEGLPDGWLNADFKRSDSFSEKLIAKSDYYKTFANVLEVRTVKDEYLIAMKLVAGRNNKRDLSDIAGVLISSRKQGKNISYEKIDTAVKDLYGNWDKVKPLPAQLLEKLLKNDDIESLYREIQLEENRNKEIRFKDLLKNQ
jgi:hypothetical protein